VLSEEVHRLVRSMVVLAAELLCFIEASDWSGVCVVLCSISVGGGAVVSFGGSGERGVWCYKVRCCIFILFRVVGRCDSEFHASRDE